jgi:DNA-binding MarR family transcriptional regulator
MKNKNITEKVRQFTRFYSHFFGLYNNSYLENKFSLTEARVIFEIGRDSEITSKDLAKTLQLDSGYLSRIIKGFEKNGYLTRKSCSKDARRHYILLTDKGKKIRSKLDLATNRQIEGMLEGLSDDNKKNLCLKMDEIENILIEKIKEQ